ncbi:hypothetical protein AeNC1_003730 [Aphanomyces euteiches]|nr:hypothetical protein AeNC1_003730 [Aphanomyces euteiches]
MVKVVVSLGAMLAVATAGTLTKYPQSVITNIDTTADPCQDLYQYACGTWMKNHSDFEGQVDALSLLDLEAQSVIEKILESNEPKIGAYFKACMDTDTVEKLGASPLSKSLALIRKAKTKKDLLQVASHLAKHDVSGFALIGVKGDDKDATLNKTKLKTTTSTTTFKLVGRSKNEASNTAATIINFEKTLARFMLSTVESLLAQASPQEYYPFSLYDAATRFPFTIGPLLRAYGLNSTSPQPITPNNRVVLYDLNYFDKTEALLNKTSLEDLKTVIEYRLLLASAPYLSSDFEMAHWTFFEQKLKGMESPPNRVSKCSADAAKQLNDLMGTYYLKQTWSSDLSTKAMEIVNELTASVKTGIQSRLARRMDSHERADEIVQNCLANRWTRKSLNCSTPSTLTMTKNIGQLGKPINKKVWQGISAQDANANYVPSLNRIVVPAAILQPPFFDPQADPAQNFGGVGMAIGHELMHGYDNTGRNYDAVGNLAPWWSNSSNAAFQSKAHCIVEQYGNFTTRSETTGVVIGNVDGHLTLGETIGDNGGLKASFRAYQEYMKTHESKHTKEMGEKLFFLSFAQGWCSRNSDAALQALLQDEYPPNRFRVFGALQNNFDFSRVFNCPADTFMNPAKKCPLGIGMSSRMQTLRFMII